MMGQSNFIFKKGFILILIAFLISSVKAQSIILRPGVGFRYYNTKPDLSLPNYFDPSFNGKFKFSEAAVNIAVEVTHRKHSYELVFSKQAVIANAFYTNFKKINLANVNYRYGGISQFQFNYNKFFDVENKLFNQVRPFIGIGIGIGKNRPRSVYDDSSFSVYRDYNPDFPNEYLDVDRRTKSLSAISYSAVFKVGFAYKIKNVERARLQAIYNLGLNKIVQSNLVYYHTLDKYYGSSTSRGSQFSLMLSMPIYLKREK